MDKPQLLGDIGAPTTPDDVREFMKLEAVVEFSRLIIRASVGFIGMALVICFFAAFNGNGFDKAMEVFPAVVPFWGTISGAVLGYLFGKHER